MGTGHKWTFSQRWCTDGQQVHKKVLNSTNHLGDANQKPRDTTSSLLEWLQSKNWEIISVGRMKKKRNPGALWMEMYIDTYMVENHTEVLKIKNGTTIWSSNSTSGYLLEEITHTNLKRYLHYCSVIYNNQEMETTYVHW